jgi:hypothetical protein
MAQHDNHRSGAPTALPRLGGPKGQIIIMHLLGLAPAGYLAAPDSGHEAGCGVVHAKYRFGVTVVTLCH